MGLGAFEAVGGPTHYPEESDILARIKAEKGVACYLEVDK